MTATRARPLGVPAIQLLLLVAITLFGRAAELRARVPVPDEVLHLAGFFLLAWVVMRMLQTWAPAAPLRLRSLVVGPLCVSLGALDEWLQSWDPGRTSDLEDLAFDCGGILIALAVTYLTERHRTAPRVPDEESAQRTGSPAGE